MGCHIHEPDDFQRAHEPAFGREQQLPRVIADQQVRPKGNHDQHQRKDLEMFRQCSDEDA
jgi:hypothetical protein